MTDQTHDNPLFGLFDEVIAASLNSTPLYKKLFPRASAINFVNIINQIGSFHNAALSYDMKCVFTYDNIVPINLKNIPDHDLLLGGYPDTKSLLFKIVKSKCPKAIILETDKQSINPNEVNLLQEKLKNLGYWADFKIFNVSKNKEYLVVVAVNTPIKEFPWPITKPSFKSLGAAIIKGLLNVQKVESKQRNIAA